MEILESHYSHLLKEPYHTSSGPYYEQYEPLSIRSQAHSEGSSMPAYPIARRGVAVLYKTSAVICSIPPPF